MRTALRIVLLLVLSASLGFGQKEAPADAVTPGELIVEPPTLICLGFEWRVEGDANGNATARVRYRKAGTEQWHEHLPLYRIGKGKTANYGFGNFGDPNHDMRYEIPDALAGSVMDLEPGTDYEVRLEMADPDGVEGEPVKTVTLSTRPEPEPFEGGEVRHVYPPGYKGEKQQPAYRSIMHAVNGFHPWCDCYQTVHPNVAPPGTMIKLHAGNYKIDRFNYREPTQRWLHGIITLVADGTPEKPVAIVAAGDGEVVIDGSGNHQLFNIMAADYLYFEGLTIKNTDIAFFGGFQGQNGCKGLTVKNCWIEDVMYGVLAQDGRSEGFYIADNVIIGRNPHDRFNPRSGGASGRTDAGYAVNLAGKGHMACHNYCADMWDVMNVFTNSLADPALGQQSRAIDFYNNDIVNGSDNFIEADGGYANIRMLRNRCFNVMGGPLSNQPVYAGPVYWIRNICWNAYNGASPLKPGASTQVLICLNNTSSTGMRTPGNDTCDIRNSLLVGPAEQRTVGRQQHIARYRAGAEPGRTVDYNAYRIGLPGTPWQVRDEGFKTFQQFRAATGLEEHGLTVEGYGVFAGAEEPPHAYSNSDPLVRPTEVDLRPAAGSPIIDAGVHIPGVTDGYEGRAPDIGALERGRPGPTYGPRRGPYLERLQALREGRYTPQQTNVFAGGTEEEPQIPAVRGATLGKAVTGVADENGDGIIESITVGEDTFDLESLVFGIARTESDWSVAGMNNFNMKNGMPTHGGGTLVVDFTSFGGGVWTDSNGEAPDFFIFEAGGNDNVFVAPIMSDDVVGKAAAIEKGAWGDTGIATPIGAGNAVGVAIEVTELLDGQGQPLSRDARLKGLRIVNRPTGMDLTCVCAVAPGE